jgi:hypothetical protein
MAWLDVLWQWLYDTSIGTQMREHESLFPWVEAFHVVALTVVIGSIAMLDLRLLGFSSAQRPVQRVLDDVLPVVWTGFAGSVVTGLLLFTSNAVAYAHNTSFQWKIGMLALLGVNALSFHLLSGAQLESWGHQARTPISARISGAVSILLWIGVTLAGRWVGFTISSI